MFKEQMLVKRLATLTTVPKGEEMTPKRRTAGLLLQL